MDFRICLLLLVITAVPGCLKADGTEIIPVPPLEHDVEQGIDNLVEATSSHALGEVVSLSPWSAKFLSLQPAISATILNYSFSIPESYSEFVIPYLLPDTTYELVLSSNVSTQQIAFRTPFFKNSNLDIQLLGPGVQLFNFQNKEPTCTAGFLASDDQGELYLVSVAHCGALNLKIGVRIHNNTIVPIGETVYAGYLDVSRLVDIGLVKLYPEIHEFVTPTMIGENGPSRPPRAIQSGERICLYGQSTFGLDYIIAQGAGTARILPDMRYRCGYVGSGQLSPTPPDMASRGEYEVVIYGNAGDSGAAIVATDGSPFGLLEGTFGGSLPPYIGNSAVSICFALEKLWDEGFKVGILLGKGTPAESLYTYPNLVHDPITVPCDESHEYMQMPYRSYYAKGPQ